MQTRSKPQEQQIKSNNRYSALSEVDSDNDSVLSYEAVKFIKKTTPKNKVAEKINWVKQGKQMVGEQRTFPPPATGDLTSVYINQLNRTSFANIRSILKASNVFMKNIKSMNWCGKKTLELITFKSYEVELKEQLQLINWRPVENFDLTVPADKNAGEDAKEYTFTQAARHFARSIYERTNIKPDEQVEAYLVDYVRKKGPRFQAAVQDFITGIERNPETFFPHLIALEKTDMDVDCDIENTDDPKQVDKPLNTNDQQLDPTEEGADQQ
jgi:hypothetical protein